MSRITPGRKRAVKRRLRQASPTVYVGKSGTTMELLNEIKKQVKTQEMVKVRIHKSALSQDDAKSIAKLVAEQTETVLVEVRGHTFLLCKAKKRIPPKTQP
jgi:RNA-binding protein